MSDNEAYAHLWQMGREINPRLPFDTTGRELRCSFSRDGSFALVSEPRSMPRRHPVPPDTVISLPQGG